MSVKSAIEVSKAATPAEPTKKSASAQPWQETGLTYYHNGYVRRAADLGCCGVTLLLIDKDSSLLGRVNKMALFAVASVGFAMYDVIRAVWTKISGSRDVANVNPDKSAKKTNPAEKPSKIEDASKKEAVEPKKKPKASSDESTSSKSKEKADDSVPTANFDPASLRAFGNNAQENMRKLENAVSGLQATMGGRASKGLLENSIAQVTDSANQQAKEVKSHLSAQQNGLAETQRNVAAISQRVDSLKAQALQFVTKAHQFDNEYGSAVVRQEVPEFYARNDDVPEGPADNTRSQQRPVPPKSSSQSAMQRAPLSPSPQPEAPRPFDSGSMRLMNPTPPVQRAATLPLAPIQSSSSTPMNLGPQPTRASSLDSSSLPSAPLHSQGQPDNSRGQLSPPERSVSPPLPSSAPNPMKQAFPAPLSPQLLDSPSASPPLTSIKPRDQLSPHGELPDLGFGQVVRSSPQPFVSHPLSPAMPPSKTRNASSESLDWDIFGSAPAVSPSQLLPTPYRPNPTRSSSAMSSPLSTPPAPGEKDQALENLLGDFDFELELLPKRSLPQTAFQEPLSSSGSSSSLASSSSSSSSPLPPVENKREESPLRQGSASSSASVTPLRDLREEEYNALCHEMRSLGKDLKIKDSAIESILKQTAQKYKVDIDRLSPIRDAWKLALKGITFLRTICVPLLNIDPTHSIDGFVNDPTTENAEILQNLVTTATENATKRLAEQLQGRYEDSGKTPPPFAKDVVKMDLIDYGYFMQKEIVEFDEKLRQQKAKPLEG